MNTASTQHFPIVVRPAGPITALFRAISAEILKMKRSLALWLTLLTPLAVAGLQFLLYYRSGRNVVPEGMNTWLAFNRQTVVLWSLLMQPLFITLETALVAQLDHSGDHWKRLFAMPMPRWAVYIAKQVINTLLIGLSMFLLLVFTVLAGYALNLVLPGVGFEQAAPLAEMAWVVLLAFLCSWLTIALHGWVALNWRSFVVASAFGIIMTIAGVMVINDETAAGFYPWTLPAVAVMNKDNSLPYLHLLVTGCLGGVLLSSIGCWLFTRKDVL